MSFFILPTMRCDRWLLSVLPYTPLGDDAKIKETNIPPTFTVHKYASEIYVPSGPPNLSQYFDKTERNRIQSVLRIGRSFSIRMSSQGTLRYGMVRYDYMCLSTVRYGYQRHGTVHCGERRCCTVNDVAM